MRAGKGQVISGPREIQNYLVCVCVSTSQQAQCVGHYWSAVVGYITPLPLLLAVYMIDAVYRKLHTLRSYVVLRYYTRRVCKCSESHPCTIYVLNLHMYSIVVYTSYRYIASMLPSINDDAHACTWWIMRGYNLHINLYD